VSEHWDLWQQDPERWNALQERLGAAVAATLERLRPASEGIELHAGRWDVPGIEVVVPPNSAFAPNDGAWRVVQVTADATPREPVLAIGAAAWFDEQGQAPREPWTRWWCHTTSTDERKSQSTLANESDLENDVEAGVALVLELARQWHWDYENRRWRGARTVTEDPVQYSSAVPGRRVG
jgi:hypothetical protein